MTKTRTLIKEDVTNLLGFWGAYHKYNPGEVFGEGDLLQMVSSKRNSEGDETEDTVYVTIPAVQHTEDPLALITSREFTTTEARLSTLSMDTKPDEEMEVDEEKEEFLVQCSEWPKESAACLAASQAPNEVLECMKPIAKYELERSRERAIQEGDDLERILNERIKRRK